jgi:hypothetical protein
LKASKLLKSEADWLTMLNGWHSHDFYSGRSGRFTGQPNLEMLLRKNLYEELYELGLSVSEGEYKDPDTKMAETIKGLDEILASI